MTYCIPGPIQARIATIGQMVVGEMGKLCEQMLKRAGLTLKEKEIEEGRRDMVKRAGLTFPYATAHHPPRSPSRRTTF